MKIYKYGKLTYPIRECPHCECVFGFTQALVQSGGFKTDHRERKMVICPDCLKMFEIKSYDLIKWGRKLPDNIE